MRRVSSRLRADILFVLLGLIPIGVASGLDGHGELAFDLCKDFGVVIISLSLVDLLWQLVAGGEPVAREIEELRSSNELTRQANRCSLVDVADRRSELLKENASYMKLVESCRSHVDISGYTLHVLVAKQSLLDELVRKARHGVKIRILLCSPDNPAVRFAVQEEVYDGMKSEMDTTWKLLTRARDRLGADEQQNFQFRRLTNRSLTASIFRVDERLSVIHYLYSRFTTETPVYVARDRGLFKVYLDEFERLFYMGVGPA